MKYKILNSLYLNNNFYGFTLESEDGRILHSDMTSVYRLAYYDLLSNAKYNADVRAIQGKGFSITSLPSEYLEIKKTRHQRAKEYESKLKLLGNSLQMDFKYLPFDRVRLDKVYSEKPLNKLEIPSFITDFKVTDPDAEGGTLLFEIADVQEIFINNDPNTFIDLSYIFSYMTITSENLKVTLAYPETILDTHGMFENCIYLKGISLCNFKTVNLQDTSKMFKRCVRLEHLEMKDIDTSSVTNMQFMFEGCLELYSLDLGNFNTQNVLNFVSMFRNCESLVNLDLCNFNTKSAISLAGMFDDCISLTNLNISSFDTSKVIDMSYMFNRCTCIKSLDLGNFNTYRVTGMNSMFAFCENLEHINLSSFDTSNVSNISLMFHKCKSLKTLDISNFRLDKLHNTGYMFSESGIEKLDLSMFGDLSFIDAHNMLEKCESLRELNIRNMFSCKSEELGLSKCKNLEVIDMQNIEPRYLDFIVDIIIKSYAKTVILSNTIKENKDIFIELKKRLSIRYRSLELVFV